jgi:hypothetical protein
MGLAAAQDHDDAIQSGQSHSDISRKRSHDKSGRNVVSPGTHRQLITKCHCTLHPHPHQSCHCHSGLGSFLPIHQNVLESVRGRITARLCSAFVSREGRGVTRDVNSSVEYFTSLRLSHMHHHRNGRGHSHHETYQPGSPLAHFDDADSISKRYLVTAL